MKKDLIYLNTRWWYRLVKVIFVILFVGVFLFANGSYISESGLRTLDNKRTIIECNVGEGKYFTPEEIGVFKDKETILKFFDSENKFNYRNYITGKFQWLYSFQENNLEARKIISKCLDDENNEFDLLAYQKIIEILNEKGYESINSFTASDKSEVNDVLKEERYLKEKHLNFSFQAFNVFPKFNYSRIFVLFAINIGIILAEELIRRLFYYVVLGSFFPKNLTKN